MFDSLKATIQELLHGQVAPGDRRAVIAEMKRALVSARLGVEDLREGVELTRRKLATEREQLATVQRRKILAQGISDAETVALAEKYERQHGDHVAVLARKLEVQEAEASLAERELGEMMEQLKSANAGVGLGAAAGGGGTPADRVTDEELGLPNDAKLQAELDSLARRNARGEADAAAEARLAELKKKMGK